MKSICSIFKKSTRSFEGQEKDEKVILLLRRHPFVVTLPLSFYALAGLVPVVILLVFYSLIVSSPFFISFLFLSSIYYLALWLLAFRALTMYTLNTVIVTDKRIIDRDQNGFFDRDVSELHLYRVQDITIHTRGIIKTVLGFGDIIVQTAASEKRFIFPEIAKPEKVKDTIMKIIISKRSGIKEHSENMLTD